MEDVLRRLFWKHKDIAVTALKILERIRDTEFNVRDWKQLVKDLNDLKGDAKKIEKSKEFLAGKGKYFHAIRKMKAAGIIYRKNNMLHVGEAFSEYLKQSARITDNWKKQAKEGDKE
jgi:hypothetical protein